ncbi:MAG: HEAT repeat domain-containing protein [Pirellulaceae bacterium]|nr:HEAT repeat domain-containing protein [Pirellulaceae bacterium]
MTNGLEVTLAFLAKTRTPAALEVLRAALDSPEEKVRHGVLNVLIQQANNIKAQHIILKAWNDLDDCEREKLFESGVSLPALSEMILQEKSEARCAELCSIAQKLRQHILIPDLVYALEGKGLAHRQLLVELLQDLLLDLKKQRKDEANKEKEPHTPADKLRKGKEYNRLLNNYFRKAIVSLQKSVDQFEVHGQKPLLELFLLMATYENPVLRKILREKQHPCHQWVGEQLRESQQDYIFDLLVNFLEDPHIISPMLDLIKNRRDEKFASYLLDSLSSRMTLEVRSNLRKIDRMDWLLDDNSWISHLKDHQQGELVAVVALTSLPREQVQEVLVYLLKNGSVAGRRAAAEAIKEFPSKALNPVVLEALDDDDQHVVVSVIHQLRWRNLPGAMIKLFSFLDSPQVKICQAAQEILCEFRFEKFQEIYEFLDEKSLGQMARMVKKADPELKTKLVQEIGIPVTVRQIRAMEMARLLNAVDWIEEQVLTLLKSDDHLVRTEAASSLGDSSNVEAQSELRTALFDTSPTVQAAAEKSLQKIASRQMG